ncbi:AEC family transporter [Aliihoeflea sp. PC F10.4]
MIAIFESTLPIFLLIALGMVLRRTPIIDQQVWPGLEQISYWILYPALLFSSIYNADFSSLEIDSMLVALLMTLAFMTVVVGGMWPVLRKTGLVKKSEYSSVFQTALRWNGFMALAIAQELFPPEGSAVVALVMAVIIIPLNIMSVIVVTRFASAEVNWRRIGISVLINPLIVACALAIAIKATPFGIYGPVNETMRLVANAALGMSLLTIGAGLRVGDLASLRFAIWLPVAIKLLLFPLVLVAFGLVMGLQGEQLLYLSLCAAVPTAMNGYFLARQLGGDAELYAASTTIQTALSFLTIPLVLAVTAQLSSG